MPVIMNTTAIAAGASNNNVIAGSAFEYARRRQIISVGTAQSATGMFAQITSGSDMISEEFEPPILTRYPIIPDEMYFSDVVEIGDRIKVSYRNPTGGALTARTTIQLQDI